MHVILILKEVLHVAAAVLEMIRGSACGQYKDQCGNVVYMTTNIRISQHAGNFIFQLHGILVLLSCSGSVIGQFAIEIQILISGCAFLRKKSATVIFFRHTS